MSSEPVEKNWASDYVQPTPDPLCPRCREPRSEHTVLPAPHDPFSSVTLCPKATFREKGVSDADSDTM